MAISAGTPAYSVKNRSPRFMRKNKANSGNTSIQNNLAGHLTQPQFFGSGNAEMNVRVPKWGAPAAAVTEAEYVVQINDSTAGATLGAATFRWGKEYKDRSGFQWMSAGETITAQTIYLLEFGIRIAFTAGATTPDFVPKDRWHFQALRAFGMEKMFDIDRGKCWKSRPTDQTTQLVIDLSNEEDPTTNCLILYDHNFGAGTTISHKYGSTTTLINGDSVNKRNIMYFNTTQPLHTIDIDSTGDGGGEQIIGHLFLGEAFQLFRHRDIAYNRTETKEGDRTEHNIKNIDYKKDVIKMSFSLMQDEFDPNCTQQIPDGRGDFEVMVDYIDEIIEPNAFEEPVFVHFNPSVPWDFNMYFLQNPSISTTATFKDLFDFSLDLEEVRPQRLK
jgi:hypothetical protein